jgi:hypothetical protein
MYRDKATSWSVEYWSDCVSTQNDRLQKDVAKICTTLLLCIKMILLLEIRNDKWRNEGELYSHTRILLLQTSFSISAVLNCCWSDWITRFSLTLQDCNCKKENLMIYRCFIADTHEVCLEIKCNIFHLKKKKWKNVTCTCPPTVFHFR